VGVMEFVEAMVERGGKLKDNTRFGGELEARFGGELEMMVARFKEGESELGVRSERERKQKGEKKGGTSGKKKVPPFLWQIGSSHLSMM